MNPLPWEKLARVDGIELLTKKTTGKRQARALVRVEDDRTVALSGAAVPASRQLPDGNALASSATGATHQIRGALGVPGPGGEWPRQVPTDSELCLVSRFPPKRILKLVTTSLTM